MSAWKGGRFGESVGGTDSPSRPAPTMLPGRAESVQQLDSMVSIGFNDGCEPVTGGSHGAAASRHAARHRRGRVVHGRRRRARDRAVERVRPGAPARSRARRAAARAQPHGAPSPPSSASLVLDRARRVNRELEAMRADLALLQGLEAGLRAPRCGRHRESLAGSRAGRRPARPRAGSAPPRQRGCVGAALHRARRRRARAGRRHRAGRRPPTRRRPPARRGARRSRRPRCRRCRREPVPLAAFAEFPLVLPPDPNPLRIEVDRAAEAIGISLHRAGRGRGHPAHRRPRGGRQLRVDPP